MFAVPGWNISSKAPVAGTEKIFSRAKEESTRDAGSGHGKKRKRGEDYDAPVTSENLGQLWQKHFGGGAATGESRKGKKEKRHKNEKDRIVPTGGRISGTVKKSTELKSAQSPRGSIRLESEKRSDKKINDLDRTSHERPETNQDRSQGKQKRKGGQSHDRKQPAAQASETSQVTNIRKNNISLPTPPPPLQASLTPLQQSMRAKLISARFRHLNETLYTTDSGKALSMFSESPELFAEYHAGFSLQVKDAWPENPVDIYIDTVKSRGKASLKLGRDGKAVHLTSGSIPLPRRPHGTCTIADMGCGDAQLARGLQSNMKSLSLKFCNFDLHPINSLVTKADISSLPLKDGEVDVAVFCLSLMGTNWINFVEEAWRILRGDGRGEVWVAEVKSRFGRAAEKRKPRDDQSKKSKEKRKRSKNRRASGEDDEESAGEEVFTEIDGPSASHKSQDETDISGFVEVFQRRGFALRQDSVNKNNKMFVSMVFTKSGVPTAGKWKGMKWIGTRYERLSTQDGKKRFVDDSAQNVSAEEERKVLKPCVYKIR